MKKEKLDKIFELVYYETFHWSWVVVHDDVMHMELSSDHRKSIPQMNGCAERRKDIPPFEFVYENRN